MEKKNKITTACISGEELNMQFEPMSTLEYLLSKKQIKNLRKDTPIIIKGKQGPTGKTTLCQALRALGYIAYEEKLSQIIELNDFLF